MPQYFKQFGYLTLGGGKLYHPSSAKENIGMPFMDWPESWSPGAFSQTHGRLFTLILALYSPIVLLLVPQSVLTFSHGTTRTSRPAPRKGLSRSALARIRIKSLSGARWKLTRTTTLPSASRSVHRLPGRWLAVCSQDLLPLCLWPDRSETTAFAILSLRRHLNLAMAAARSARSSCEWQALVSCATFVFVLCSWERTSAHLSLDGTWPLEDSGCGFHKPHAPYCKIFPFMILGRRRSLFAVACASA